LNDYWIIENRYKGGIDVLTFGCFRKHFFWKQDQLIVWLTHNNFFSSALKVSIESKIWNTISTSYLVLAIGILKYHGLTNKN